MSSCKKRFLGRKSKVKRKSKRFDLLTLCPLLSNEGDGKVDVDSKRNNLEWGTFMIVQDTIEMVVMTRDVDSDKIFTAENESLSHPDSH